ncbi:hypothetical protein GCM10010174_89720 [Kutzneria viridogrisea]
MTTGTGEVEYAADRATLWLTYRAKEKNRARAVSALTAQVAQVEPLLARDGVEVRSRRLSVHANWENKRNTGCIAEQNYSLRVTDTAVLEDLLNALLATEPANLNGPNWELADQTAATREAQHLAVAKARLHAEGYASALGLGLGELVRITDGSQGPGMGGGFGRVHYAAAAASGPDVRELNLEPELITVSASCTATWTLVG